MPRSGSKRSQEGFARDKPSETSRKEIKDASHRVSSDLRRSAPSSWPRGGREGGREVAKKVEEKEKEEMEEDDEKEVGGRREVLLITRR